MFAPAPLLLVLFAFALAACGSESASGEGKAGGTLPSCAKGGTPIDVPAELQSFPLPSGSVLDHTRTDAAGNTIYGGYVPGDVRGVRDFLNKHLPKSGYEVGEGDSEDEEAEAEFRGHGGEGRWKVHSIADCDGALTIEVGLT